MSEQIEDINVEWNGPFSIDQITNKQIDKKKDGVCADDIGLYQIYGCHPVYGDDVLVYIGRTKNKHGFKSRLKNRWVVEIGADSKNIQIYLGTMYSDLHQLNSQEIEEKIDKAEVLLINALKPAYNSSNIQSVKESFFEARFIVHNTGNFRALFPVLDSQYFWQDHKNIGLVNKLASIFELKVDDQEEYYGFEIIENEYFPNISTKYSIWIGVDYELWDLKGVPFAIEIYSEDKKLEKIEGYEHYKYESEEFLEIYYKAMDINIVNSTNLKEDFLKEIKFIIDNIKLS